jgi:insulysin
LAISTNYLSVDHDVAHLKPLTKQDIIEFFNHYLHPQSLERSKLCVQLVAQSSGSAVTDGTTTADQKQKLARVLSQNLNSQGIASVVDLLEKRLETISLVDSDQSDILSVVKDHATEDAEAPAEKVTEALSSTSDLLTKVAPSLGIEIPLSKPVAKSTKWY